MRKPGFTATLICLLFSMAQTFVWCQTLTIGSWNIGPNKGIAKEGDDILIRNIVDTIKSQNIDILMLQELYFHSDDVRNQETDKPGQTVYLNRNSKKLDIVVNKLKSETHSDWSYIVSHDINNPAYQQSRKTPERFAYIWKEERINFRNDEYQKNKMSFPRGAFSGLIQNDIPNNMKRYPMIAYFVKTETNEVYGLINVHLDGGGKTELKLAEFKLVDQIIENLSNIYKEIGFVIAGDYNLTQKMIIKGESFSFYTTTFIGDDTPTTLRTAKYNYDPYLALDHFSLKKEDDFWKNKSIRVNRIIPKFYENNREAYRKNVSDHFPISLHIDHNKENRFLRRIPAFTNPFRSANQ